MVQNKKTQNALEFLIVIFIMIIFFIMIVFFLYQRMMYVSDVYSENQMDVLLSNLEKEIFAAKKVDGNYERVILLPEDLSGHGYSLEIIRGREMLLESETGSYVNFLPFYVYGEIVPGYNKIIKKGDSVGICWKNCSDEYLFNITGNLQCMYEDEIWASCNIGFGDNLYQVRTSCHTNPGGVVRLEIHNLDDNVEYYSGNFYQSDTDYYYFTMGEDGMLIDQSGNWSFGVQCGPTAPLSYYYYYVPYGYFKFYPLQISSDCSYDFEKEIYACQREGEFSLKGKVECVGGECGDAKIWLDP